VLPLSPLCGADENHEGQVWHLPPGADREQHDHHLCAVAREQVDEELDDVVENAAALLHGENERAAGAPQDRTGQGQKQRKNKRQQRKSVRCWALGWMKKKEKKGRGSNGQSEKSQKQKTQKIIPARYCLFVPLT